MAGRTRVIAGMTRVGAVFAPSGDPRVEIARLAGLGYRAVRERVLLAPLPG